MYSELKAAAKLSNEITPFFNSAASLKCCLVKPNNKPITSLIYADDLLILSETEEGLIESFYRLGKMLAMQNENQCKED